MRLKNQIIRMYFSKIAKGALVSLLVFGTNLSPILTLAEEKHSDVNIETPVEIDNLETVVSLVDTSSIGADKQESSPPFSENQAVKAALKEMPNVATTKHTLAATNRSALDDESMVTVTSQTGEDFVVRVGHIEEDVKNQLVERYDLFLTPDYASWQSDVRELIYVTIQSLPDETNAGQIVINLLDNNGVGNFAYHINGEIYYTGHSFGGCDYVPTYQIPLDKYQTGDIINSSDYDISSSRFGDVTIDDIARWGVLPDGVEIEPEIYAIADFHGNFMKTPYYGYNERVHVFPGFRVKKETITPLPPINLHFLIDNNEVWGETSLKEWSELSSTLDDDQEVWDYLRTQNVASATIDPFLNYGHWLIDFEYKPGTFEVSDVYLKMTTTEKSGEVLISHDYGGTVSSVYSTTTSLRNAAAVLDANVPLYAQDQGLVTLPESTDAYQTATGWEMSSTEKIINGDKYEFIYHFKPKMTKHKVERGVTHIYHNYDDYSVLLTSGLRNDPTEGVKTPVGMVLDSWKIDSDLLISSEVNRDNLTTREVRQVHYTPVFKQQLPTTGNFTTPPQQTTTPRTEQVTKADLQPKLPNTGEQSEKLLTDFTIAITSAVSIVYFIERKKLKNKV